MLKRLLLLICLFLFPFLVNAENVRTRNQLLVPNDVTVTEENIEEILKTPSVDASLKIYDFINVLSVSEERKIYQNILDFTEKTNLDCVIVTTNDLKGFSISEYGYHFYDYNDFLEEGIIFVISVQDNKKNIFMGNNGKKDSKIFTTYNDQNINSILKYVYDNVKIDEYYQASVDFIQLLEKFYEAGNGSFVIDEDGELVYQFPLLEVLIITISLTIIIILLLYKVFKKKMISYHMNKIDSSTLNIQVVKEEILK